MQVKSGTHQDRLTVPRVPKKTFHYVQCNFFLPLPLFLYFEPSFFLFFQKHHYTQNLLNNVQQCEKSYKSTCRSSRTLGSSDRGCPPDCTCSLRKYEKNKFFTLTHRAIYCTTWKLINPIFPKAHRLYNKHSTKQSSNV